MFGRKRRGRRRGGRRRHYRKNRRGSTGLLKGDGFFARLFSGRMKFSKIAAASIATLGFVKWVLRPLSNGDSWIGRLTAGMTNAKTAQAQGQPVTAAMVLNQDAQGNNAFTVLIAQLDQNLPEFLLNEALAGGIAWVGRKGGF